MKCTFRLICFLAAACFFGINGWGQSSPSPASADTQNTAAENVQKPASAETSQASHQDKKDKKIRGPGKEMGKGGEDIGVGAAKGTGDVAKGTAGAVGNLAHGNVGGAGADFGKGAGKAGKNVAVGTGKGLGKIGKGIGGELKKL